MEISLENCMWILRFKGLSPFNNWGQNKQQHLLSLTDTTRAFADKPPSANETFFGMLSQELFTYWLVCISY